jgi:hypothetical protein
VRRQADTQLGAPGNQRRGTLVEEEQRRSLSARGRRRGELRGQRRLAGSCRADDQRARALLETAAEQQVHLGTPLGSRSGSGPGDVRGDEARERREPPRSIT